MWMEINIMYNTYTWKRYLNSTLYGKAFGLLFLRLNEFFFCTTFSIEKVCNFYYKYSHPVDKGLLIFSWIVKIFFSKNVVE